MDKQKFISIGIKYDEGLQRFMGNVNLYEKYLLMFLSDSSYTESIKYYNEKDYANLQISIHTLKGLSGNLSIMKLFEITSELNILLRENKTNEIDAAFKKYISIYKQIYDGLLEVKNAQQ